MASRPGPGGGGGGGGVGSVSSGARGSRSKSGGGGGGFDLGAYVTGQLLDMYNSPGTYSPGSAGSPGGRISRAGERAAVTGASQNAIRQSNAMYDDVVKHIRDRNPQIQGGFDANTANLRQNAVNRRIASDDANAKRDSEARQAAATMGLTQAPVTENTQADATQQSMVGAAQNNAESWAGYNQGAASRGIERNNAAGDAFRWEQGQQANALQSLLLQALSGLGDISYGGSGGSAGGYSGGLKPSQKISVLGQLRGQYNTGVSQDLATARLAPRTTRRYDGSGQLLGYNIS